LVSTSAAISVEIKILAIFFFYQAIFQYVPSSLIAIIIELWFENFKSLDFITKVLTILCQEYQKTGFHASRSIAAPENFQWPSPYNSRSFFCILMMYILNLNLRSKGNLKKNHRQLFDYLENSAFEISCILIKYSW
jgi:hypothetical protein